MNRHLHAITAPVAEDLAAQDDALGVECPLCGAERDAYCTNHLTGKHLHGRISHPQRLTAARKAAEPEPLPRTETRHHA